MKQNRPLEVDDSIINKCMASFDAQRNVLDTHTGIIVIILSISFKKRL
jgi:hypothetical protein